MAGRLAENGEENPGTGPRCETLLLAGNPAGAGLKAVRRAKAPRDALLEEERSVFLLGILDRRRRRGGGSGGRDRAGVLGLLCLARDHGGRRLGGFHGGDGLDRLDLGGSDFRDRRRRSSRGFRRRRLQRLFAC